MGFMNLIRGRLNPHAEPTASFDGKTILLTGGSDGIGLEAAVKFLRLGASSVTIGARNTEKAEKAKAEIEQRAERPGTVRIWPLEMNNYKSVAEFAERASKELPRIDVALLNAGLMFRDYVSSPEGWEEILQVNTLSTIYLAILLLPQLRASRTETDIPRLVFTASSRFKGCTLEELTPPNGGKVIDYLNRKDTFNSQLQYSASKLLIEFGMRHIAEHTKDSDGNIQVIVSSVCPGFCSSSLGRCFDRSYEVYLGAVFFAIFANPAEVGGRTLVSAAGHGVDSHGKTRLEDHYPDISDLFVESKEGRELGDKVWQEILEELKGQRYIAGSQQTHLG
ncbi:hypothetical protein FQN54_002493 [Arachnomyces sp. PD_36]|nr:hypothetical protein FQN54_002493 [Arachnomyces sp. PD_36]